MKIHLALFIIILFLNTLKNIDREKYILPFSFLLVFVYWAIRYDYGLDYWNYYRIFNGDLVLHRGWREGWFYWLIGHFNYYYQVIIADSAVIIISLYHLVKKYISAKYYWLFFLMFFCATSFHFNLISAMRSTLAACILYWAFDLFFITKKRWGYFLLMVFVATNIHTSAIVFFIFPLIYLVSKHLTGKTIFIILIIANILSTFYVKHLYLVGISFFDFAEDYEKYANSFSNTNIIGFVFKSVLLFPSFFICKYYDNWKEDSYFRQLCTLTFLYLLLFFLGLDFQGRFTVYLYPFFIITFAIIYHNLSRDEKLFMLMPYLLFLFYGVYTYYRTMLAEISGRWSNGNTYYYKTIFEAPFLI